MKKKMDNRGMTLVETLLSFVILGILMVVASQIIHSSTEVYYYTKTTSYGIQAAQIVSTEIRGDVKDALPLFLKNDTVNYVKISGGGQILEFIDSDGMQVKYELSSSAGTVRFTKESFRLYDEQNFICLDTSDDYVLEKDFDSKYIGMGYEIKEIKFSKFVAQMPDGSEDSDKMPIGNCPLLEMELTVCNNQYGEYVCKEYIPLYGMYDIEGVYGKISES